MIKSYFICYIFFLSLILRLIYVLVICRPDIPPDGVGYDTIALNLSRGLGFSLEPNVPTPVRAPLYPCFLSIIYYLFGHNYTIVRVVQALLDAFVVVFVYLIARKIFDEKIAMISAFIYTFYLVMFAYVNMLMSEVLFTFLFALTILLLMTAIENKKTLLFALSGITLGLSTLTRGTTILFPLFVAILLVSKNLIKKWLVFVLLMVLTMSPWTIRNFIHFREFIPVTTTGIGLGLWVSGYEASGQGDYYEGLARGRALGKYYQSDPIGYEKHLIREGLSWIKQNPVNYLIVAIKRLPRFWWTSHSSVFGVDRPIPEYIQQKKYLHLSVRFGLLGLHGIFLIFASIGIILSIKNWQNSLILILILIYFSVHIAFDPCPRYHLPAIPYLFIFTAKGIWILIQRIKLP